MPPKRFARFVSSNSVSRPQRQRRTGETPEEFKKAAEEVAQQLNQFLPIRQAPPPPPPKLPHIDVNDDNDWINEQNNEVPRDGEGLARNNEFRRRYYQRRYRNYLDKRQDCFREWGKLENQMTSTCIYCQHVTKNWTSQDSHIGTKPPGCNCTPAQQNLRNVDLIDSLGFHSNHPITFCSCHPDVIQLLYHGYIASSPSKPRTAFSIRLLQFYYAMWQAAGLSKGGFIEGLLTFISTRSRTKLVGMLHTTEDLWAAKCPRCFGPAENEDRTDQELYSIFCMDGNFQQRHNTQSSKDVPTDDQYPSVFVKPSEVDQSKSFVESTIDMPIEGGQVILHNSGKWLLARMNQAISTEQKSQTILTNIYALPNPHKEGEKYTEEFFIEQWAAERKAMLDPKSRQEEQKLELGELLCLEDDLDIAWRSVAQTPQQVLTRARQLGNLQKRIQKQKKMIGINEMTDGLQGVSVWVADSLGPSEKHTTLFLKVWYAKSIVRHLYLAIKEEKRPLEIVQQVGMATKLGQRGQEKVLASIKARAAKLRPALDTYNRHLTAFKAAFPDRVAPKAMDFKELLASEPDDQFWNDGLFTHGNEPWASDRPTQVGMRAWARLRQCNEEKRRLQWETRRLMRWTTQQFQRLLDLLLLLGNHPTAGQDPATHAQLQSFMNHSTLNSLAPDQRTIAVKVLVSKHFDRVCQLYEGWNSPVLEVFRMNGQVGDDSLARVWHYQMAQVTFLQSNYYSSKIPGDFESLIEGVIRFCNITHNIVPGVVVMGGVAGNINVDEEDENNWENDVEDIFEWDMNLEEIDMMLQQNESGEDDD
ncbi:uncharacterized protein MELLADRAFT_109335 [Melampsora larici-populina 98AG31]|uniref:CxC1-like cysteine cluster associated with KDZ transposases domain-containing protein n=1 Tax=Melampsora larici-populina (strain 98AG31 / pathotype 3-4-7) TaxID=747676 RepID=F4RW46_MELLP|nr:uncharacterized protein MELLADRAFT_109335 [Melampsora larici-populina 98AG31]EGG03473.1 hypothetical protein MELLADRAFT_109335 [Melampsora larici-populina 98AG31]